MHSSVSSISVLDAIVGTARPLAFQSGIKVQVFYEGGQRQTKLTDWIGGTKGTKRKHSALGGDETPPRLPLGAE